LRLADHFNSLKVILLRPTSSEGAGKPRRTFVNSASALNKPIKSLIIRFVLAEHRINRDHFDRVRLSTFPKSDVQKITIANGSSVLGKSKRCSCSAQRARPNARS
jgi:hypothetical protein